MSPLAQIKAFETVVRGIISQLDVTGLPKEEKRIISSLKNELADAKLDIRDYEFSDTRAEQLRHSKQAIERLEKIRTGILAASEYNVFNAVDVAQFTAQLEQIIEEVR